MRTTKRSSCASGSANVPSSSIGFWVARTRNGSGSGRVSPSIETWPSSMASSSALCVRGVARLISSTSSTFVKTGPGTKRKWSVSRRLDPSTSLGNRSGVPWTRAKVRPSARLNARVRSVLPTPGTSSTSACPCASNATTSSRRAVSSTTTARATSSRRSVQKRRPSSVCIAPVSRFGRGRADMSRRPARACLSLAAVINQSLWRHPDFMKLWTGQTVSRLGSVVTRTAVPLVALLVLNAGPFELAMIVVAASLAVLLVGFFAGAWVDRIRRRPVLISADALRAVLLFSIPAAYYFGVLRIEQLYVVVFLEGCLGVLFDAAYPAYVPSLIGVDRVVEGNSKLAASSSLAEIGGPGLAGGLVQFIGAPFTILLDAVSYVFSAITLIFIRAPEPARPPRVIGSQIRHEILEG